MLIMKNNKFSQHIHKGIVNVGKCTEKKKKKNRTRNAMQSNGPQPTSEYARGMVESQQTSVEMNNASVEGNNQVHLGKVGRGWSNLSRSVIQRFQPAKSNQIMSLSSSGDISHHSCSSQRSRMIHLHNPQRSALSPFLSTNSSSL